MRTPRIPTLPGLFLTCLLLGAGSPPAAAQEAEGDLAFWSRWLETEDGAYEATPVADGRVLLIVGERRRASSLERTIEKTLAAFDELVPLDGEPDGEKRPRPVLIQLEDAEALGRLRTFLGSSLAYLAGWAASADRGVGFVVEEPLAAAWLYEVPGLKKSEWKPENELANRLSQALLHQRHGRMPQWLALGLAWHVELETRRGIYCFPFRAGFVGKREHKGWSKVLSARIAEEDERPLAMEELSGWPRGVYDDDRAALSWGAATLLARYFPDRLPEILAAFEELFRTEGRVTHPDGSWELVPDYDPPAGRQEELLDAALGTDFLAELERFCRLGRAYVRPR